MANKQQILYPGEHAPWRFRQSNILLTPCLRANTRGYARTMCQGMQQMLKVLETLYEAVQRCLQKSAHHLFSAFFQLGLVRFAARFDADRLYCLEKPSFFAAAQLTFNGINPETALTCNFGPELHCSILWHGTYRQMRSKYSHHFNTSEAPKFPAASPVKDAKIACQPLELTTKVV